MKKAQIRVNSLCFLIKNKNTKGLENVLKKVLKLQSKKSEQKNIVKFSLPEVKFYEKSENKKEACFLLKKYQKKHVRKTILEYIFDPNKVFVFDSLRLPEGFNETWKEKNKALADSQEDLIKENLQLVQEKNNHQKEDDSCLQKVQGELFFKRSEFKQF